MQWNTPLKIIAMESPLSPICLYTMLSVSLDCLPILDFPFGLRKGQKDEQRSAKHYTEN